MIFVYCPNSVTLMFLCCFIIKLDQEHKKIAIDKKTHTDFKKFERMNLLSVYAKFKQCILSSIFNFFSEM